LQVSYVYTQPPGGTILKTPTTETPKETEQHKQKTKLPYEKPELNELGNVEDMTAFTEGSLIV